MKVEYIGEHNFCVYLNKYNLSDLELKDKQCVEEYFRKLFINLKNNHSVDIYGYYNIMVYADNKYGLIIDVFKLNNDYFKLSNNKIEMKIMIDNENDFLYEIDDYFFIEPYKDDIKSIYYKDKKYYVELNDTVDDAFYLYLIEHSNIVFNDKVYDIIFSSSKL
ncbi:MAG: hypothetical protein PHI22_03935 [Bacilli bacterium]|nr:hypothetical protein [Bacilli bacterium]MDD4298539.1 hypothetical protein [Bacilli bacterium]MDD4644321.1 hypothetical protein [Bacilli bacterium]